MNTDKNKVKVVNIGTASLLVVFMSLCLTAFAILSLSTAKSDYAFSEKLAVKTAAYYEANNKAEQTLHSIARMIDDPAMTLSEDVLEQYGAAVKDNYISWQTPVSASQSLDVELLLTPDDSTGYKITKWQVVNTNEWVSDQTLDLINFPNESEN